MFSKGDKKEASKYSTSCLANLQYRTDIQTYPSFRVAARFDKLTYSLHNCDWIWGWVCPIVPGSDLWNGSTFTFKINSILRFLLVVYQITSGYATSIEWMGRNEP